MLSAVVGRGLPSCGGRPLWGFSASRVLLGLLGGRWGGVVLRGLGFQSFFYCRDCAERPPLCCFSAGWVGLGGGMVPGGGFSLGGGLRLRGWGA